MPAKAKAKNAEAAKGKAPAAGKKAEQPKKMKIVEPQAAKPQQQKQQAKGGKKGKKNAKKAEKKQTLKQRLACLFQARPKDWTLGVAVPHKRDMTHFVAWPRYIRVARQKRILLHRLKTPPAINMFNHSLDKATAVSLFKLMAKMRPEEEAARKARRLETAKKVLAAMDAVPKKDDKLDRKGRREAREKALKEAIESRPATLRYGLKDVTNLVIKNKAQLVVIASDVDPIELVLWLPALCRKKKVPYCIVKNKARLGQLVHKKTTSVVAFTQVPKDLRADFTHLVDAIKPQFLENMHLLREWGEPVMGLKHQAREAKRLRRIAAAEKSKK